MLVFTFRSKDDSDYRGFSNRPDGSNLPQQATQWLRVDESGAGIILHPGHRMVGIGPVEGILADIERQGFHVKRLVGMTF